MRSDMRLEALGPMIVLDEWMEVFEKHGAKAAKAQFGLGPNELSNMLVLRASDGGSGWATDLVGAGADPSFVDDEGNTALSQCIHSSAPPMGRVPETESFRLGLELLGLGADANGFYQDTRLLDLAVAYGRSDIACLLVLAGAEVEALRLTGQPWVEWLRKRGEEIRQHSAPRQQT